MLFWPGLLSVVVFPVCSMMFCSALLCSVKSSSSLCCSVPWCSVLQSAVLFGVAPLCSLCFLFRICWCDLRWCAMCCACFVLCCSVLCRSVLRCSSGAFFLAVVGESLVSSGVDALHDVLAYFAFIVVSIWSRNIRVRSASFVVPYRAGHTRSLAGSVSEAPEPYIVLLHPVNSL